MPSAIVSTGSSVYGLVPGMKQHLGGGIAVMYTNGNPSGIVTPIEPGGVNMQGVSGAVLAYDHANNKLYTHVSGANGNVWNQMGSVAFA